jgi:hypothetical protein
MDERVDAVSNPSVPPTALTPRRRTMRESVIRAPSCAFTRCSAGAVDTGGLAVAMSVSRLRQVLLAPPQEVDFPSVVSIS